MIYDGWSRFQLLQVELGDGRIMARQFEDHGEASAVLPYDEARRVALLVRQPRIGPLYSGLDPYLLEIAAGLIEPGEAPDVAVRREALEELGVQLGAVEFVTTTWSVPALSSERIHLYLAAYTMADRVAAGGGVVEEGEEIEVLELPLQGLLDLADAGQITDMKSLTMIWALARRRPDLFE